MKAIVLKNFGGLENLELKETELRKPNHGEIVVKVKAISLNPVDYKIRVNGTWAGLKAPAILGYDAAGTVEQAGDGVTDFAAGDEVFYTTPIHGNAEGTYAEYNIVNAAIVAKKPANLSFEESAAIPLAGGTAWEGIVRRLDVRPGETILIHSGAGGVGSFAVQFAHLAGARVIATSSPGNFDTLKELGADIAVDYNGDVTKAVMEATDGAGADCAYDIQGPDIVSRVLPAVRPFARIACVLAPQGALSTLSRQNITLHGIFLTRERKRLEEMKTVFESGRAKPLVGEVLPFGLESIRKGHRKLESGHVRGKIALSV